MRRHGWWTWILFVASASASASAPAQDKTTIRESQRWQTEDLRLVDDAKADSPNSGVSSKLVLEGSEQKSVATLRVGSIFGPSEANLFKWSLGASAPFSGDKEDERQIGDLTGLTAGSTATLEFGWIKTDSLGARAKRAKLTVPEVHAQRDATACQPYAQTVFGVPREEVLKTVKQEGQIPCSLTLFEPALFEASPQVQELRQKAILDPAAAQKLERVIAARETYHHLFWSVVNEPRPLWTAGARLQASRTNFKYFLATDLATRLDESKNSGAISAYVNRVYQRQLIGLGYTRTTTYEPGRKTEICVPIGTAGALDCSEKIIGAPTRKSPDIVFAEWRYLITPRTLAISPLVEYDLDEHEWAARVPLYGAVNKDGDLVGGLSLNWDSKEDEVAAVVFFGKKFALFE